MEDTEVGRGRETRSLGARGALLGDLEAQVVPATQGRGEGGSGAGVGRPGVLGAVGARLRRLWGPLHLWGNSEHATGGPLDVRAQRGRRRVDVEHSTSRCSSHDGPPLAPASRYAFPSGLEWWSSTVGHRRVMVRV